MELQRIIPSFVALLQYEWLTGNLIIGKDELEQTWVLMQHAGIEFEKSEFAFWNIKAGRHVVARKETAAAFDASSAAKALRAAAIWEECGSPYEHALFLFEAGVDDKRKAIVMVQDLGATAVYEKRKQEMRALGIKIIPLGIRNSTRSNAALSTAGKWIFCSC